MNSQAASLFVCLNAVRCGAVPSTSVEAAAQQKAHGYGAPRLVGSFKRQC